MNSSLYKTSLKVFYDCKDNVVVVPAGYEEECYINFMIPYDKNSS